MIKIVNALPPYSDKNTYYLKNGEYWFYEDDNWILQSPWTARYIAQTDEWKYIGLLNIIGVETKYEKYLRQNLAKDLKGSYYILGDNAEIRMRPTKTYFVQFNDRTSKLVKSESKRDLTYKFSWHWKF